MPNVTANGIRIEYETFGRDSHPAVLLIMELGTQMIYWEEEFCEQLADKGLYVIRFNNRDSGFSTVFQENGWPDAMEALSAKLKGKKVTAPYSLEDMADDTVGLLDVLRIASAHVCGMSMGGMIAQIIGYRHPSRITSLIIIMSGSGNPDLPDYNPEMIKLLSAPPPPTKNAYIKQSIDTRKALNDVRSLPDEKRLRLLAGQAFDNGIHADGTARHLVAMLAHKYRKSDLELITVPTLVIYGADDPMVSVEGVQDIATTIPDSKLMVFDKMGHSIPKKLWPDMINAIRDHVHGAK